jgi:hypothetical protein
LGGRHEAIRKLHDRFAPSRNFWPPNGTTVPRLSYPRLPDRASLDVTRTIANHGSLCNGMFFGVRNCPVFIRALGRNSGFCFKIDPNCIFPPARRYSQEALWSAKHSPTVTRTVANHGSLSNRKVFRVRNHPGIVRAPRSPPLAPPKSTNTGTAKRLPAGTQRRHYVAHHTIKTSLEPSQNIGVCLMECYSG